MVHLGMEFAENKKYYSNYSRGMILALINKKITPAKILYASKEELIEILLEEKRNEFLERYKKLKSQTIYEKKEELSDFLNHYSEYAGYKKAIIGLQSGLNILNQNCGSSFEEKAMLKEDGIYGKKSVSALNYFCKNYNSRIIKKYILKGIINSIIFDTKNDNNVNTEKLIIEALTKLKGEI